MELDVQSCISELEKLKEEALKGYNDIKDHDNDSCIGRFLQLLLLDGCVVVEFIRECCAMCPAEEDEIINISSYIYQIFGDFLLLENLLPFFVLNQLHDMTK
ncbi:hypothetical protein RDI58_010860 [Solanum bulbocastanum]|uniref:Uncharacterized protein n=1 Tax=Solanum bulbocastanum TaxID=147425 RepID=A0AAN8TRQ0_SOLBU